MTNKESDLAKDDVEDATIIEDDTVASSAKKSSDSSPINAAAKKHNPLAALALLVALLAVVATVYIGWHFFQQAEQLQSLTADSQAYHQQTKKLKQSLQAARNEAITAHAQRDQQRDQLASALQDANLVIAAHGRRLRSLTSTTTDDWRLAEVEYLLRLANQRILISQDSETALSLLTTADQILLTLADPRFFDIRKSIAEDRAALVLVSQQDLDGVFLRLSALTQQLEKLPLIIMPTFKADDEVVKIDANAVTGSWRQTLSNIGESTWQELKSLVVVNKRNADIKPLLPPEQQYYLRGNLQLMINQSQLALLDGRQSIYSDSLYRAERWLYDYFPNDEYAIQSVIAEIQALQKIKIDIELPDVTGSLLAVKTFLSKQHQVDASSSTDNSDAVVEPIAVNKDESRDDGASKIIERDL